MRVFAGIELSTELREALGKSIGPLQTEFPEVSWLEQGQLFLVLRFLGLPRPFEWKKLKRALRSAAAQVAPFDIVLNQIGCFPSQDPVRTIWANVNDPSYMLTRLGADILDELAKIRYRADDEDFAAHIPLGRVSGKIPKGPLRRKALHIRLESLPQLCPELCLVESKLGREGPVYSVSERYQFQAKVI